MSIIFRFNVPFTDKYFLITSRCPRYKVEKELFTVIEEWCTKKQSKNLKFYAFLKRNPSINRLNAMVEYYNEALPRFLINYMKRTDTNIVDIRVMFREIN